MRPIIKITDTIQTDDKSSYREKTILLFDLPVYKRIEAYVGERKDKTVGFATGSDLTQVEDYD